jgi:hypothetical protein
MPSDDIARLIKLWRHLAKEYRVEAERTGQYDYGRGNFKGLASAYNGAADDLEDILKFGWDTHLRERALPSSQP